MNNDTIYDIPNKDALASEGWKSRKYENFTKKELIDFIECLEHNWAMEIKANRVLQIRLGLVYEYLKEAGHPEMFSEIVSFPSEVGYKRKDKNLYEIDNLINDKDDYWYRNWIKAQRDIKVLKDIIDDIKSYTNLYLHDLDYSYDDEPIDNYVKFDVDYIIKNILENFKIDEDDFNESLYKISGKNLIYDDMVYPDEDFYEDERKVIEKLSIPEKDNIYDYYEEEDEKNA